MKKRGLAGSILAVALMAVTTPVLVPAQQHRTHRYKFIDLGTFGGHNSFTNGSSVVINRHGTVVGEADTDSACPCFPEGVISPAF